MKVLLDTHVFLWLIADDARLSETARKAFLDSGNQVYLSPASLWEIGVKMSLGRLSLREGWLRVVEEQMKSNSIHWLPIETVHCERVSRLPFHHRDPFDRMLISQAVTEEMCILSSDGRFLDYGVRRIW